MGGAVFTGAEGAAGGGRGAPLGCLGTIGPGGACAHRAAGTRAQGAHKNTQVIKNAERTANMILVLDGEKRNRVAFAT